MVWQRGGGCFSGAGGEERRGELYGVERSVGISSTICPDGWRRGWGESGRVDVFFLVNDIAKRLW